MHSKKSIFQYDSVYTCTNVIQEFYKIEKLSILLIKKNAGLNPLDWFHCFMDCGPEFSAWGSFPHLFLKELHVTVTLALGEKWMPPCMEDWPSVMERKEGLHTSLGHTLKEVAPFWIGLVSNMVLLKLCTKLNTLKDVWCHVSPYVTY